MKNSRAPQNHRIFKQRSKLTADRRTSSLSNDISTQIEVLKRLDDEGGFVQNPYQTIRDDSAVLFSKLDPDPTSNEERSSKGANSVDRFQDSGGINSSTKDQLPNGSYINNGFMYESNGRLEDDAVNPCPPAKVVSVELNSYNPVLYTTYKSLFIIPVKKNRDLTEK